MLTKLFTITTTTFTEIIRQPIFGVLLWVSVGMLILNPSIASFSLETKGDVKIMKDVALSTMLLYGLLASVFSATGVITREIESFTVLTVISKPVSRPVFLIGKFLGVAGAMAISYYLLSLVFLMTARHGVMSTNADKFDMPVLWFGLSAIVISLVASGFGNYVYGWNFFGAMLAWIIPLGTLAVGAATFFDKEWNSISPLTNFGNLTIDEATQVVYAIILIFFAVMILTAFAVALSTRFSQVMTLMLCSGVFMVGLLSDYYFGLRAEESLLSNVLYHVLPNFQFFWLGDALTQDLAVPFRQVAMVAGYAVLYSLAILSLGIAMFQTREVG